MVSCKYETSTVAASRTGSQKCPRVGVVDAAGAFTLKSLTTPPLELGLRSTAFAACG
jgi:hypothetical protein